MRTPWPQLALFLVAVSLAVAAGGAVGPVPDAGPLASAEESAAGSPQPAPPGPGPSDARRAGARFAEPPVPPPSDPGGGPAMRDVLPPRRPDPAPRARWMGVPVAGVDPLELADTFAEPRVGTTHGGLDIPAPRGTPVLAVAAGTVQKIHESEEGGHTVYVLDASRRLRYYYAHLQGYREDLQEGESLRAGQPIGYVGDSGDAVPGDTHLHFAVFRLGDSAAWGLTVTPVNPLPYLRGEEPLPR